MKIHISNVTSDSVLMFGQTLSRGFVECIMLPLLVSHAGKDRSRIIQTVDSFESAGLSLREVPEALRFLTEHRQEQARLEQERQEFAQAAISRVHEMTPKEQAERRAKRIDQYAKLRAQGDLVRASSANGVDW